MQQGAPCLGSTYCLRTLLAKRWLSRTGCPFLCMENWLQYQREFETTDQCLQYLYSISGFQLQYVQSATAGTHIIAAQPSVVLLVLVGSTIFFQPRGQCLKEHRCLCPNGFAPSGFIGMISRTFQLVILVEGWVSPG